MPSCLVCPSHVVFIQSIPPKSSRTCEAQIPNCPPIRVSHYSSAQCLQAASLVDSNQNRIEVIHYGLKKKGEKEEMKRKGKGKREKKKENRNSRVYRNAKETIAVSTRLPLVTAFGARVSRRRDGKNGCITNHNIGYVNRLKEALPNLVFLYNLLVAVLHKGGRLP